MVPLLKLRLQFFVIQTAGLYKRYTDFAILFFLLFGQGILTEPTLFAKVFLQFLKPQRDLQQVFLGVAIWFGWVFIWAKIHKNFITGGSLSHYIRTLPISARSLHWFDLTMLLKGMWLVLIPIAISLYTVLFSSTTTNPQFWAYFCVMVGLTFSISKHVIYGGNKYSHLLHASAIALLLSPSWLNVFFLKSFISYLIVLLLLLNIFKINTTITTSGHHRRQFLERFSFSPNLVLLITNYSRLLHQHWHDSLSRILWACLPLCFAWWLIHEAGNTRDAFWIVHISLGIFIGVFSGIYRILFAGRIALNHFVKSIAHGELRLSVIDYLTATSLAIVILLCYLTLFYFTISVFSLSYLAELFFYYLSALLILGAKWFQLHKQTVVFKFIFGLLSIILGVHLL